MVGVTYTRSTSIKNWYKSKILPIIRAHADDLKKSLPPSPTLSGTLSGASLPPSPAVYTASFPPTVPVSSTPPAIEERLSYLKDDEICDILFLERGGLEKKYDWIKEYGKLCDFTAFYSLFVKELKSCGGLSGGKIGGIIGSKSSGKSGIKSWYKMERKAFIIKFSGEELDRLMAVEGKKADDYAKNFSEFGRLYKAACRRLEELNEKIKKVFAYDYIPGDIRGGLVRKMDVSVCPYCNRQYIQPFDDGRSRYLGDLDHLYLKDIYQLFSMSLWNLMPCCKPCNQIFKWTSTKKILFPTIRGFNDSCILTLDYENIEASAGRNMKFNLEWKIQPGQPRDIEERIRNNIEMFRLNEIYQYHKEDIKEILWKRFNISGAYGRYLSRLLTKGLVMSEEEQNRILYGTSLSEENFGKELLAKMTYDVVKHN